MSLGDMNAAPRCAATSKATGRSCRNPAVFGLAVCTKHGGGTPRSLAKHERARALAALDRFVKPLLRDDPGADPLNAFEVEFRRTLGRIRWYDEQLACLATAEDLVWGKTKTEVTTGGPFSGTSITYEAKAQLLHDLQFRERHHLMRLARIALTLPLDSRTSAIQSAQVARLDQVLVDILTELGLDVQSPHVRRVVHEHLAKT